MWTWFDELALNIREERKKMPKFNYECTNPKCKYVDNRTVRKELKGSFIKNVKKCPKCKLDTLAKTIAPNL